MKGTQRLARLVKVGGCLPHVGRREAPREALEFEMVLTKAKAAQLENLTDLSSKVQSGGAAEAFSHFGEGSKPSDTDAALQDVS